MTLSRFVQPLDAHLSSVLAGECAFSLPEATGEFDRHACARFYGDVIEGRLLYLGYDQIEIEVENDSINVAAFNSNGSSFDLGFLVNDRMGIEPSWLSGVSVAHGNEVPDLWEFQGDISLASLDEFLQYHTQW